LNLNVRRMVVVTAVAVAAPWQLLRLLPIGGRV
jgi:hypothetical protein